MRFRTLLISVVAVMAMAQDVPPPPAHFIAADVHVSPKTPDGANMNGRPAQLELRNVSLLQLIQLGYAIETTKIFGGPRWLDLNKYVVVGRGPAGSKTQELVPMLKPLLVERFGLKAHEEQRPYPSYTLTLGKGKHKLKASDGGESGCRSQPSASERRFVQHITCRGYALSSFTSLIGAIGTGVGSNRIVDKTGLEGKWDIDIEFTPAQNMAAAGADAISIAEAIDKQLGLKLEMQKTDQPVLVIESVNDTPTPNEPDIESKLVPPQAPATIEVATIKPTPPGGKAGSSLNSGAKNSDGKTSLQLQMRGLRMNNLIQQASEIPLDRVIGLPAGINDQSWDLNAQLLVDDNQGLSSIRPLLMGLLKERFNLQSHVENRPVDAYRLVAVKPKMPVADPSNRASCTSTPPPDGKDPREKFPTRTRLMTCLNMTLDEFAERLQSYGSGYVNTPVVNATKLDGMWDFMLNFSNPPPTNNPGAIPTAAATAPVPATSTAAVAADPSADISFFDAISSQLGLKLELEKRVMPVLVIDHIDPTPTDN